MAMTNEHDALAGPAMMDGDARDYFALLKPRVMSLVVFTAFVGMCWRPEKFIRCWASSPF
jgi:protoheme IX farnesyltransferase